MKTVLTLLLLLIASTAEAVNGLTTAAVSVLATMQAISVTAPFTGDDNANATVAIQFRVTGSSTWLDAYPPYIDRRATIGGVANPYVSQARGPIVGLTANTAYDIQVTWTDADGVTGTNPRTASITTVTTAPVTGGSTINVTNDATMTTALSTVVAGQTVSIAAGTYAPITISTSGSAGSFIKFLCAAGATFTGVGVNQNILVSASYIIVDGCTLSASDFNGLVVSASKSNIYIQNLTIQNVSRLCANDPLIAHYGDAGIALGSGVSNVFVLSNSITSTSLSACVQSPTYDGPGEGVSFSDATTLVVKGNTITGSFRDGITADSSTNLLQNVDLIENVVSGHVDDGVEAKGGNLNVRVGSNRVTVDAGNTCLAANTNSTDNLYGPLYIYRNTCRVTTTTSTGQSTFKLGGVPMYVFHNSVDSSPSGADHYDTFVGCSAELCTSRNNAIKSSGSLIDSATAAVSSFDYDLLYLTSGASFVYLWNGTTSYDTWALWRAATSQESHGVNADPSFADTTLRLSGSSPAIDAGVALANFNGANSAWPTTGSAPDMGAYEYGITTKVRGGVKLRGGVKVR